MSELFHSDRLLFREFEIKDAENFYHLNRDAEVMRYTGDLAFESIEESAVFIQNYSAYQETGYGRWTVLLKANKKVIGWCGLKKHPDGSIDLGYRFHQKHWNKGYGTEAAKRCLKYGFENLKLTEIIGRTAQNNLASVKVIENIGMKFWKLAPCEGIENSIYYKITADEFN